MLFRGYILGNLLEKYNEFKAVIISSILFTLIHVSSVLKLVDYLDIFLMGIIFAYLYVITKSLYLSIGVHFFSDFVQEEIFMVQNSSSNPYSIISFNISNNLIIGGLDFGPKIEVLFVLTEIIILFFIYLYKKHQKENI
ncbi:MAG: CPBP family intramembrane metalloprotease [Clostridium butyricum]|nr:CPBP family intramembrane metalloprotease [Clostridium butyricum]